MKRPVVLIAAAAVLFAAGYFTGQSRLADGNPALAGNRSGNAENGSYATGGQPGRGDGEGTRSKTGDRSRQATAATANGKGSPFLPGQGRQWLESITRRSWDGEMVGAIDLVQRCALLDPAAAQEMAETSLELIRLRKEDDPAVREAFPDEETLGITVISSLFRLSQTDPQQALELLDKHNTMDLDSDINPIRQMIYANMAKVNLPEMMGKLDTLQGDERTAVLDGVMRTLGAEDPQAAIELLQKNPGPAYREQRQTLVDRLAVTDPDLALRAATAFTVEGGNTALIGRLVENSSSQLAEKALAWVKDYHGDDRDRVSARLLAAVAAKDPKLAADHISELGRGLSEEEVAGVSRSAVNSLFQKDQEEAAGWVRDLKPGPVQESARMVLAQNLMEKNPAEAGDIINTMQDGPSRTMAVELLVAQLSKDTPEEALKWVDTIPEGPEKDTQRTKVFSQWMLTDPDAAAAKWNGRQ